MDGLKSDLIALSNVNAAQLEALRSPLSLDGAILVACIVELDCLISHALLVARLLLFAKLLDCVEAILSVNVAKRMHLALQVPQLIASLNLTDSQHVLGY